LRFDALPRASDQVRIGNVLPLRLLATGTGTPFGSHFRDGTLLAGRPFTAKGDA